MSALPRAFAFLAAVVAVAGCSADEAVTPAGSVPAGTPGMGCRDGGRASSLLTDAERRSSIAAGPLTFVYAREQATQPAAGFRSTRRSLLALIDRASSRERERDLARRTLENARPGSYGASEMRIRVRAGQQATLTVPPKNRKKVSLVYTFRARSREHPGAQGIYRVDDGDPAVTFRACADQDTEFLGAFVVAGARCVPLIIASPRQPAQRRLLSFGAGDCLPANDATGP